MVTIHALANILANVLVIILVNVVQLVGVLVPLAGCVCLLRTARTRTSMYLLLANLGCLIINASYMLLLQSRTHEGAMTALKMEYFGNVVFYLMFGLFLWSYLRLKKHRWVKALLIFWCVQDAMFLSCIWFGDGFRWVFENLAFHWNARFGLVLIQAEPGSLYMMRYSVMCLILLCCMIYTVVRMYSVEIASERNNLAKLAVAQLVILGSLNLMLWFNFSFDIVPVCASLSILSIIVSVFRNEFFGITEFGQQWVFDQMEDAFVIVDEMYGYLESNAYAGKIFPELNYKRKNETVAGDMYRLFTNPEKIVEIGGKHYNKKIEEMKDKGETAGYSMLLVDITEQYELMERVREEKERADAANQAKSAFVSNVSHEIRTPMNAIVGMTQILLRRDLPQQEREYLMNIKNSGNALLAIVNDLLDMSKIESGKMELVDEEYDFMAMLSDLGMIILNRIGSKPVELLFDIDVGLPAKLYGDALRIRQIIINLMNNATKFTEEGYVRLTVKVQEILQDDMELFISVSDTGQGIRQEDLGKLFGSFQQVDTRKNHHKEGTGLGLSISKQLVELMRGNIGVASEYGKGSEFYFTIHQRVVDGARAVPFSGGRQAMAAGSMKNRAANEMVRELAGRYGITYVEDIMDGGIANPLFYFTDQYEALGEEEKRRLEDLGAVVCGMQNPMAENHFPEGMLTMNKPLYSRNFCGLIESGQRPEESMEMGLMGEEAQGAEEEEPAFTAPGAKILIVDDNEINCMVAEEMLKPLQMQIDIAPDGRRAFEMVQRKQYDLIFMDHLMPVMNGIEATKKIRELEGEYYRQVPIIALTANTGKEQQEEYALAGMNGYLSKPIDMTEICRLIRKWVPGKIQ